MAKLYYFDGRGRGEIVRLTLAAAGIEFTEELSRDRATYLKWMDEGKLPFGQVPVLEIDGKFLAQSGAIVRYLARKAGLFGNNEDETVLVDMYYEAGRDFFTPVLPLMFQPEDEVLKKCKEQALPKYLPKFEKRVQENGNTGYLVGSSLTLADVSLVEALLVYVEYLGKEIFDGYPGLQNFYSQVTSEPKMAAFLSGPQRKAKNSEKYIKEVKLSLGWI